MTLFDRALSKAYARRSAPPSAPPPPPVPVARGWVARLRAPSSTVTPPEGLVRPIAVAPTPHPSDPPIPLQLTSAAAPSAATTVTNAAPGMDPRDDVVFPPDLQVRVDPSHAEVLPPADAIDWKWPVITGHLQSSAAAAGLAHLADSLERLSAERQVRSLAIFGPTRASGRTTLVLSLARCVIERSHCRVLLVDLDLRNPKLASELGVQPEVDLSTVAFGEATEAETLVELIPERLGLLPLCHPLTGAELTRERTIRLCERIKTVASRYDLTLIDSGPDAEEGAASLLPLFFLDTRLVDGCLAVARHPADSPGVTVPAEFHAAGIEFLGTVETFVPAVPRHEPHFTR